jgi:predicted nucleotidyltransferase
MNIALENKHLKLILQIIRNTLPDTNAAVYVFGSRATGRAKAYSDIDLAIDYDKTKLQMEKMIKLSVDFENSLLPYRVDIVDLNNITKEFKSMIANDLVRLI